MKTTFFFPEIKKNFSEMIFFPHKQEQKTESANIYQNYEQNFQDVNCFLNSPEHFWNFVSNFEKHDHFDEVNKFGKWEHFFGNSHFLNW